MLEKIKNFFNPTNLKLIITGFIVLLCLVIAFLLNSRNKLKTELAISNQNIIALNDTIKITINKHGDKEASKTVVISSSDDLKKVNKELANELSKEKGKIFELNQIIASLSNNPKDTIKTNNTIIKYNNGVYHLAFNYDTVYNEKNSHHIKGLNILKLKDSTIQDLKTFITLDQMNFNLVTGLKENTDGTLGIFVRSDYPNFNVSSLEGAIIDPDKNPIMKKISNTYKFHVGPYLGVGFDGNLKSNIQIGVGLQYSLFGFNF